MVRLVSPTYSVERYQSTVRSEHFYPHQIRKSIMLIANTLKMSKHDRYAWAQRWPSFAPRELASDDYSLHIPENALDALQRIRDSLGRPMRITSAYRTPKHNRRVKGLVNSQHLKGHAFDIAVPNVHYAKQVEKLAIDEGFTAIGRYPGRHFIHIDMRPPKASGKFYRWGRRWD